MWNEDVWIEVLEEFAEAQQYLHTDEGKYTTSGKCPQGMHMEKTDMQAYRADPIVAQRIKAMQARAREERRKRRQAKPARSYPQCPFCERAGKFKGMCSNHYKKWKYSTDAGYRGRALARARLRRINVG